MSFNAKTICLSAAALLAVAGGVYALMPNGAENAPQSSATVGSDQSVAVPAATNSHLAVDGVTSEKVDTRDASADTAEQAPVSVQPAAQAPKKLTQQQLTPPPLSEDEELQKAAERESNF